MKIGKELMVGYGVEYEGLGGKYGEMYRVVE